MYSDLPIAIQSASGQYNFFEGTTFDGTLDFRLLGANRSYAFPDFSGTVNCSVDGAVAPATNAIGIIADYYGTSATRVLTTPDSWEEVIISGITYKRPLYL